MKLVYSVDVNNFAVQVEGANLLQRPEDGAYFAEIAHGAHFAIQVKSNWGYEKNPFECEMTLNGDNIGIFQANTKMRIETKPDSGKKLTAFVKGSGDAYQAGQASSFNDEIGLIKLVLYPSKERPQTYKGDFRSIADTKESGGLKRAAMSASTTPMQIGLQGKSDQTFKNALPIDRDYSNETTIYIRLIGKNSSYNEITPLNEVKKQTPFPKI